MPTQRREFLSSTTLAIGAALLPSSLNAVAAPVSGIKAVAFDAFPIFDPRPIFARVEKFFPGRGAEFSNHWRTRQFEYTWLRTIGDKYADFWATTEDALRFAAKMTKITLEPAQQKQLMEGYTQLQAWPDVLPVLKSLKSAGIKIGFLSNFTPKMLESSIESAKLNGMFDFVLSTDLAKTYKPSPKAYQLGIDTLKLKKEEILFVAFAGWDACGAKWFGYPTYWVNRLKMPAEELDVVVDDTADGLTHLPRFLGIG